jgi:hypothetical protein
MQTGFVLSHIGTKLLHIVLINIILQLYSALEQSLQIILPS